MLWFDRGGMDNQTYQDLAQELGVARPRVLGCGLGPNCLVIALPDRLVVRQNHIWKHVMWHEIVSGGWDPRTKCLTWRLSDNESHQAELTETGQLPELFRERINSSIITTVPVAIGNDPKAVIIAARRNPANRRANILWMVIPQRDVDLKNPEIAALVEQTMTRVQADFAI